MFRAWCVNHSERAFSRSQALTLKAETSQSIEEIKRTPFMAPHVRAKTKTFIACVRCQAEVDDAMAPETKSEATVGLGVSAV